MLSSHASVLRLSYPYFLANRPYAPNTDLVVTHKYTGDVATRVAMADGLVLEQAIAAAHAAAPAMARFPAYKRRAVLQHCVMRFTERAEELAQVLCIEAGKPIRDSRGEVARLIDTFRLAAEECSRTPHSGDVINLEISERATGYMGMSKRVPIGPCSFITPFNFPLNLVAHKVAPAIAAGCPFVLKPASLTPIGALLIGEILAETDLPLGAFSIVPSPRTASDQLVEDERFKLLSFTGSAAVGWDMKRRAGKKKVVLELGGNAACVVDQDIARNEAGNLTDGYLSDLIPRLTMGAFYQSGQSCISVQRIYIHEAIYARVRDALVEKTRTLPMGDPADPNTIIGPMISEAEAKRLEGWINRAAEQGARILCGGQRHGALLSATLLENVPESAEVCAEEAFGPVAVLATYTSFDEVLERINHSRYGLQAGLFVRDMRKITKAWDRLDVGGVVIGDVPSWRVDNMPYGGVKDSGVGREGVRYAMEDMSEMRLLVIRDAP